METSGKGHRVIVTGGSGKAGRYVVQELFDHGFEVLNLDLRHHESLPVATLRTDLTDAGQVFDAFAGMIEARGRGTAAPRILPSVVHLAAVPSLDRVPDNELFRVNVLSTYNVLDAASKLGIRKVVFASSESIYGIVFASRKASPAWFPLDEEQPVDPMDSYALSKVVNESTGRAFHARTGMDAYALRIGNVIEPHEYPDLIASFPAPERRRRITWSYIDARDLGQACRLAVATDGLGFQVFNVANDEVSSDIPTAELLRRFFPSVPVRRELGPFETLLSNRRAKELLGFRPAHSWMAAASRGA
jgi:nucleoside-diphosphate-sugar epimerase